MENNIRCANCFFWTGNRLARDIEREQGNCHRMPIAIAGIIQKPNMAGQVETVTISAFPRVPAMQWCGEFQPVPPEQKLQ